MKSVDTFNDIVGNDKILQNLKNAIDNNRISQCYIIDGGAKTGKETIARIFAKALLCEKNSNEPCLSCTSCRTFDFGNNPDVFIIEPEKKQLGISEIRAKIIKELETRPFLYKYKVFIIKDASNMTLQAQNALLKTIEEPPNFAVFLFLSNNYNNFVSTVLSRCTLIKIKPLSVDVISSYLYSSKIADENASLVFANYSMGSLGKALQLAKSEEFSNFRSEIIADIGKLDNLDLIQMYDLVSEYDKRKEKINEILDIYLLTYRDSIILKQTQKQETIIQRDIYELISTLSKFSLANLINKVQALLDTKENLSQNINFTLSMEQLLLRLKER